MNISAVLAELGHPWIDGYKPYGNYQQLLADVVSERRTADGVLVALVNQQVLAPATAPVPLDSSSIWEDAPRPDPKAKNTAESSSYKYDQKPAGSTTPASSGSPKRSSMSPGPGATGLAMTSSPSSLTDGND